MITLVSIRLRNFRKVREGIFAPLTDGVTGLSGENGVGKSSFLHGALWALWGVRPDDVPTSGLRRQGSSLNDECSVSVLFAHGGQVIEVIRELRGKSNKTIMNIFVDGKEQTVTSVGAAEKWIRDRLKIDVDAFTTAFVVRQKELDSLVDARPAERRATIERLSGIERMSAALKTARAEENDAKKTAAALPGSEDDVDLAAALVAEHEELVKQTQQEIEAAKDALESAQLQHDTARRKAKAAQDQLVAFREAEHELESKKNSLAHAQDILSKIQESIDSFGGVAGEGKSSAELEALGRELVKQRDALRSERDEAARSAQAYIARSENLRADISTVEQELSQALARVSDIKDPAKDIAKVEKELAEAQESVSTFVDSAARAISSKESLERQRTLLEKSIATLRDHADEAECPTCHTHLEDPTALISEMKDEVESLSNAISAAGEEVDQLVAKRGEAENRVAALLDRLDSLREDAVAADKAHSAAESLRERLESLQQSLGAMEVEKPAEGRVGALTDALRELEENIDKMRTEHREAKHREQNAKRYQRLLTEKSEFESKITELRKQLDDQEGFVASLPQFTDAEIADIRSAVEEAESVWNSRREAWAHLQQVLGIYVERLEGAKRSYNRAVAEFERKKAALALARQKAAVSDLLDEFRKNRIASIAPELSETATALISAMTNGHYTEVLLDENFTPSVVDTEGNVRPVSWLSGGEESVVALALRIAIGDLMTGGEGGLLWLDEVLTAQDANRRSSLLNTLRNLTGRQIVMINHTPDANDMVDKIITIKGTDNGSVIENEDEDLVD